MRKLSVLAIVALVSISIVGCSQQPKSASSSDAIKQADQYQTVEEKATYLVSEAKAYVSSEKYEEAVKIAQHVINKVDQNSQEAQKVLTQAQEEIKKLATQKLEEAQNAANQKN